MIKKVLILGDFIIDEHWLVGLSRFALSRRTGPLHQRSLNSKQDAIALPAGSALSAFIFELDRTFDVTCVGRWSPEDTEYLGQLLVPELWSWITPHTFSRPSPIEAGKVKCRFLCLSNGQEQEGTTRIIRVYQRSASGVELIQRIDWEQPRSDSFSANSVGAVLDQVKANDFDAILVKDMSKGTVTKEVIDYIKNNTGQSPIFVYTKRWEMPWLSAIADRVALLFISPAAVTQAVHQRIVGRFVCHGTTVTKEAIEEVANFGLGEKADIVISVDNTLVIGRYRGDNSPKGVVASTYVLPRPKFPVDGASVLYTVLAMSAIRGKEPFLSRFEYALSVSQQWMNLESSRIPQPGDFSPCAYKELLQAKLTDYVLETFDWKYEHSNWEEAYTGYGIVSTKDSHRRKIQLWRSCIELDGYVCVSMPNREVLRALCRGIEDFIYRRSQSAIFLVSADPGSGKTYLAESLARVYNLAILSFNITQMISKTDILDCFDTVATTQAQDPSQPIMVHVDEVNALLEAQHVFGAFLSPIEKGVYVRTGKSFQLDPCVWFFTGTYMPDSVKKDPSTKFQDFISRLDDGELRLVPPETRTELAYLSLSLLKSQFTDLIRISYAALDKIVESAVREKSIRSLARFLRGIRDVENGEIGLKNMPKHYPTSEEDKTWLYIE